MKRSSPASRCAAERRCQPAGGRRLGACLSLVLGLVLATVSASDPVSAEQMTAEADAGAARPVRDGSGTAGVAATGSATPAEPGAEVGVPSGQAAGTGSSSGEPGASAAPADTATTTPPTVPAAAPTPAPAAAQARGTPPPPARSLLPLVQPLWSELSDAQRKVLAPLEPQWNTLTREEKRPWLSLAARLPQMSPENRARAEKRIREWAALTPDQRRLARDNYRLAKQLPKEKRVATWEQYQQMTPEQQAVLREAGWTSNTAARHAGAPTGLAKEAAKPLWQRLFHWIWKPEPEPAASAKAGGEASR